MEIEKCLYASCNSEVIRDITLFIFMVSLREGRQQIEAQSGWVFSHGSVCESLWTRLRPCALYSLWNNSQFFRLFSLPQKDAEIMRMIFPLESLFTGSALQDTRYRHRPLRTLIQNQTQKVTYLKRLYEIHSAHRKGWKPAKSLATLKWSILELHQHDHKTWNVFLPMDKFRDILPFRNNHRDHSFI